MGGVWSGGGNSRPTRLKKIMKAIKVLTVVGLVMMLVCAVPHVAAQDDDEDEDDYYLDLEEDDDLEALDEFDMEAFAEEYGMLEGECGCGGDPIESASDVCPGDMHETWENTLLTTTLWQTISSGEMEAFCLTLRNRCAPFVRAEDGRTALHWAFEFAQDEMVDILTCVGADQDAEDAEGKVPRRLAP